MNGLVGLPPPFSALPPPFSALPPPIFDDAPKKHVFLGFDASKKTLFWPTRLKNAPTWWILNAPVGCEKSHPCGVQNPLLAGGVKKRTFGAFKIHLEDCLGNKKEKGGALFFHHEKVSHEIFWWSNTLFSLISQCSTVMRVLQNRSN